MPNWIVDTLWLTDTLWLVNAALVIKIAAWIQQRNTRSKPWLTLKQAVDRFSEANGAQASSLKSITPCMVLSSELLSLRAEAHGLQSRGQTLCCLSLRSRQNDSPTRGTRGLVPAAFRFGLAEI